MKKIMKRIILICIACIVLLLFVAREALYSISYHEKMITGKYYQFHIQERKYGRVRKLV